MSHVCAFDAPAAQTECRVHQDKPQNPWPHLKDFFVFKSVDERNASVLFFPCVLCQPKETAIKGHRWLPHWTTTDNGSNFVKAFSQFGTEADLLPDIPESAADPDVEGIEDVDPEAEAMDEVEYISVEATFDGSSGLGHNLPVHMKCAAHTFSLVASVDADKALGSTVLKSAYRKAIAKAQALWNQQTRSTVPADYILDELKRRLVVPNNTRWNSTYDSAVVLNDLLQQKRGAVHRVMTQLKLQSFPDSEIDFLKEYAQVMSSVAKALIKIQGEDQAYLGSLLPTVAPTIVKLKEAKSKGLLYCSNLVDAIQAGITKRFGPLLEDQECQLAAAFHPKFCLFWLEKHNYSQLSRVKKARENVVETALRDTVEEGSSTTSNEDEDDDFFSSITQPQACRSHRSMKSKPVLINLFIKYNTAIPSSAALELLFSIGKDILRAKRATLSEANFERLMFLKGNTHHLEEMEEWLVKPE
uniref:HAT C-terminal dimerisation domain-containing protein n=1 Tax=Salarias fasciatus TaxID=181472 RepID=A0A672F8K3_SALFA